MMSFVLPLSDKAQSSAHQLQNLTHGVVDIILLDALHDALQQL